MTYSVFKCPLKLGKYTLSTRLVLPPMATSKSDANGLVSPDLLDYYNEKTEGGYFGLVITEHSFITVQGQAGPGQMSMASDAVIPGQKALTECIHRNGSLVIAQLNHAGAAAGTDWTGMDVISASTTKRYTQKVNRAATANELAAIVTAFAEAAQRAVAAGYDGVEIHSAHRYLLDQFYSPLVNRRTDLYGGSLQNRLRLHLEIIHAVRERIGRDKLLLIRLGAVDYMEGGNTLEDAIAAGRILTASDELDALDISGGMNGYIIEGREQVQGYYTDVTAALKAVVNVPVIMTGGITEAAAAAEILESCKADLVGVGRAVLKDSDWIKRALT